MGGSGFSTNSKSPGNPNRGSAVELTVLGLVPCLDNRIHTIRREENTEKKKRKLSFCFSGYRTGPGKVPKTNQTHCAFGFLPLPPWAPSSAPNSLASSVPGLLLFEMPQLGTLPRPGLLPSGPAAPAAAPGPRPRGPLHRPAILLSHTREPANSTPARVGGLSGCSGELLVDVVIRKQRPQRVTAPGMLRSLAVLQAPG